MSMKFPWSEREMTKKSGLEKIIPMILAGVGLHDKYKIVNLWKRRNVKNAENLLEVE